jgi:hypothetical protein
LFQISFLLQKSFGNCLGVHTMKLKFAWDSDGCCSQKSSISGEGESPVTLLLPRSWTCMLNEEDQILSDIVPERISPLKASQLCFPICGFCHWSHLTSPPLGSTASVGRTFILMRPFLWGLEHWYVLTKKSICSNCPQMPSQNWCYFVIRYNSFSTVDASDLLLSLCWSHGR